MQEDVLITQDSNNQVVRESYEFVHAKNGLTEIQMNMFFRALTKFDLNPDEIDIERRYRVEFQRSEIPRISHTKTLEDELKGLQNVRIERVLPSGGWECLIPFPKVGEYQDGTIQIWFDGEYLKPILEQKKGYSVFHIAEMFSLTGGHAKRLFEIFCSYKNRSIKTFDFSIETIKEILGVSDKYENNPSMFLKMVILPALQQINKKTSVTVKGIYRRRKGRAPGAILFSVERRNPEIEQTPPETQPAPAELAPVIAPQTPLNEKQQSCYNWLINKGFTDIQASNCALNDATLALFFRWKWNNSIDADLSRGTLDIKTAKALFFGELKKHNLRI